VKNVCDEGFIDESDLDAALVQTAERDAVRDARAALGRQLNEDRERREQNFRAENPHVSIVVKGALAVLPAAPPEFFENQIRLINEFFDKPSLLLSTNEQLAVHLTNKLPNYPTGVATFTHKMAKSTLLKMFEVLQEHGVTHLHPDQCDTISKIKIALRALGKAKLVEPTLKPSVVFGNTHVFINGKSWKITLQPGRAGKASSEVIRVFVNGNESRIRIDALRALLNV